MNDQRDRDLIALDQALDAVFKGFGPAEQDELRQHYFQARSFLNAAAIRVGLCLPNRRGRKPKHPPKPLRPVLETYDE